MTAYTLHSQGSYGLANGGNPTPFTLGTEFEVSQSVTLSGIWFFSSSPSTTVPASCCIFDANSHAQIAGSLNSSPTWSGAAASGWIKCTYASGPTLSSGSKYVVAVCSGSSPSAWYSQLSGYWTSGAGGSGISNGPLSAPASASAVNGQAVFVGGATIAFPSTTVSGFDFGVDVEVTVSAAPTTSLLMSCFP